METYNGSAFWEGVFLGVIIGVLVMGNIGQTDFDFGRVKLTAVFASLSWLSVFAMIWLLMVGRLEFAPVTIGGLVLFVFAGVVCAAVYSTPPKKPISSPQGALKMLREK